MSVWSAISRPTRQLVTDVLAEWHLDADLVTLSVWKSGLGREGGGDGLLGFSQAFLTAGSQSVCPSLWKVDDAAADLLMERFYQNLLGRPSGQEKPLPKAEALAEAKSWLRQLPAKEALAWEATLIDGVASGKGQNAGPLLPALPAELQEGRPYAHPKYWAAFVLIGAAQGTPWRWRAERFATSFLLPWE